MSSEKNACSFSAFSLRAIRGYKPFVLGTGGGNIPAFRMQSQLVNPQIEEMQYEDNPRTRPLRAAKPGQSITSGRTVKSSFRNIDGAQMKVELGLTPQEEIDLGGRFTSSFKYQRVRVEDEDGKEIYTYTDVFGKKVATRTFAKSDVPIITLFGYDIRGFNTLVINPEKQKTHYRYNKVGLLYEKQTVDGGFSRYMYDRMGQLVLRQNQTDINANQATWMSYDAFGRLLKQARVILPVSNAHPFSGFGYYTHGWRNVGYADILANPTASIPEKEFFHHSYPNPATLNATNQHTGLIYRYWQLASNTAVYAKGKPTFSISYDLLGKPIEYRAVGYNTDGLPDWETVQVHPMGIDKNNMGKFAYIDYPSYNLVGSLKEMRVDIHGDNVLDMRYLYEYDARNRLKKVLMGQSSAQVIPVASYYYDEARGVVTKTIYHGNESNCEEAPIQHIDYAYDVRDRLTGITSELFDYQLRYDGNNFSGANTNENFNGNIHATRATYLFAGSNITMLPQGQTDFSTATTYRYRYDGINRLVNAHCHLPNPVNPAQTHKSTSSYTFDKIGNLSTLTRQEDYGNTAAVQRYDYVLGTNRLQSVTQILNGVANWQAIYTYDANGNLTNDTKRNMHMLAYGRENLPSSLIVNGNNVLYAYDAGDSRFWKESGNPDPNALQGEWYLKAGGKDIAVLDYTNNQLTWFFFGDKRIAKYQEAIPEAANSTPNPDEYDALDDEFDLIDPETGEPLPTPEDMLPSQYYLEDRKDIAYPKLSYYLYDHLGNTRVVFQVEFIDCCNGVWDYVVESAMDYYPYGKTLREYQTGVEKYLTTQHERDAESGLDYRGARFYDSDVARFLSLDPLAADYVSWSAYNYVLGNPTMFIDPTGRSSEVSEAQANEYDAMRKLNDMDPGEEDEGDNPPPSATRTTQIIQSFKYDKNKWGKDLDSGTDIVTETVQTTSQGMNSEGETWVMTQTSTTVAEIDAKGNVGGVKQTVYQTTQYSGYKGRVATYSTVNSMPTSWNPSLFQTSREFQKIVGVAKVQKLDGGRSLLQTKADRINLGISIGLGVGTGFLTKSVVAGVAVSVGTGLIDYSILPKVSPEQLRVYHITKHEILR